MGVFAVGDGDAVGLTFIINIAKTDNFCFETVGDPYIAVAD